MVDKKIVKKDSGVITLRLDDRDTIEIMSFLLYRLRLEGIGLKVRNRITMRFIDILRYRGVRSKYKVFYELGEFIEVITKNRIRIRVGNSFSLL